MSLLFDSQTKSPLLSFLVRNDKNIANLKELNKAYESGACIPFLGAGVSVPCGIRDWDLLLDDIASDAKDISWSESGEKSNLDLAQELFNYYFQSGFEDRYYAILENKMTAQYQSTTLTLLKMVLAFNVFATTNFDNSIFNACKFFKSLGDRFIDNSRSQCELHILPEFTKPIQKGINIYHLHGHKGHEGKRAYVFTRSEYDNFYPKVSLKNGFQELQNCIESLYKNNNLIFIGFSF